MSTDLRQTSDPDSWKSSYVHGTGTENTWAAYNYQF